MTALLSMLILGAVSWLFRIAFITLLPAERLPTRFQIALDHLAPAVLASIVAVELVTLLRGASPTQATALLAAAAIITAVAYHTRNVTIACALGLCTVLALHYLTA
ncbi:AzlD domain-containing protein [Kribbella sp. VKM Ac-2568]|uniref:AzlD domain-containing protein n=1 Tax=Kribbella sp. VKM Ac-2568 TaxID=2512219 RepID=UPI0010430BD8|nr:AzlD domain-containing protein [Kribbella sp. VKM Ac-2568]TCM48143.1 branched-subunit amino acid transport protein [Kribbella sp. VKM Ac-2568]